MNGGLESSKLNLSRKMPPIAMFLAAFSVVFSVVVGFYTYKKSFEANEKAYQAVIVSITMSHD